MIIIFLFLYANNSVNSYPSLSYYYLPLVLPPKIFLQLTLLAFMETKSFSLGLTSVIWGCQHKLYWWRINLTDSVSQVQTDTSSGLHYTNDQMENEPIFIKLTASIRNKDSHYFLSTCFGLSIVLGTLHIPHNFLQIGFTHNLYLRLREVKLLSERHSRQASKSYIFPPLLNQTVSINVDKALLLSQQCVFIYEIVPITGICLN